MSVTLSSSNPRIILTVAAPVVPKRNSIFAFAVPLYSKSDPSELPISELTATNESIALTSAADPGSAPTDLANTVVDAPHIEFELHGNQFCFRGAERAGRKFKHKETIEL